MMNVIGVEVNALKWLRPCETIPNKFLWGAWDYANNIPK
jgi:hypothetical protein